MGISKLDKPRNTPCPHCTEGVGCSIYALRPPECQGFYCVWLYNTSIGGHWRPADSGLCLHFDPQTSRMEVHVDPDRPGAWMQSPFHEEMRAWSAASMPARGQVIVWEGEDLIAILPHADKHLGPMRPDQLIVTHEKSEAGALTYDVMIMDRDDPRLSGAFPPAPPRQS
jgi:hypothetical protein